jgi:methylmalonyl-CoA mutase N-terminal domain/subunit
MNSIKTRLRAWLDRQYKPALKKIPERKPVFKTGSGIEIDPLYIAKEDRDYFKDIGFPGIFPFTRGIRASSYRSRLWTIRQYAGFGSAEATNKRFRYLLGSGTTGLSVAFDLPTQIGYDSDHPLAEGEVGRVGVPVSSLRDMEILFKDISLQDISTSMTINATAAILLAFYISLAENQGADLQRLSGTVQNDILKEYIARGTYIFPPEPSIRLITDIFKYCQKHLPRWNTISISGYHIREAGSTAAQEVAFTFANALAYVDAALRENLGIDEFAGRLSFFFNAHNDFFEEIAKFRAARRIWAKIMKERCHAKDPASMQLRFHTQTGGSTLTAQQPYNNIVRVTVQAMAAVLGGTQSLHTCSFDEALALPTEEAVRIALRTQQILAEETGIAETIDPAAGSYYLEHLTDTIEKDVWHYIREIDSLGGSIGAIRKGYFRDEIARSAYEYQKK